MLLTSLPVLTVPAAAYSDNTPPKTITYTVRTRTADERNAKTDNDVYCIVVNANGQEHSVKLDKKGDDFQRGEWDDYSFELEWYPWEIHRVGFEHRKGVDAVKLERFSFWATIDGTKHTFIDDKIINTWFNKYKKTYSCLSATDRQVSVQSNDSINAFGKSYYFDGTVSGNDDIVLNWNGMVTDQYYYTYNFFKAVPGAVDMTFTASGKSYTGKSDINFTYLETNDIVDTDSQKNNGYVSGLTLDTDALLDKMEQNGIYKFTLTSTVDYEYDYDQYGSYSKTLTVYRTAFSLGKATATTKPYTPKKDNNFYNETYTSVRIKIPVVSRDNYNASTIASNLAKNINSNSNAKVYYGAVGSNDYIVPTAHSSGSDVYLTCTLPKDYANTDGKGITVTMSGVTSKYNNKEYKLDTANQYYESYISTHKIDTEGPAITVNSEDQKLMQNYGQSHTFRVNLQGNEMLYYNNTNGTRTEGFFSYQLLDGKKVVSLNNYKKTPTTRVPYATNSTYTVEPTGKMEGEYTLQITARDMANNVTTVTYPVKIDNIAPRVTYKLQQSTQIDNSKRNVYTFTIDDAPGEGRLYYCIVPKGQTVPTPVGTIREQTGTVASAYGIWSFIDQKNSSKSVAIEIPYGQYFEGTLYWYTSDKAGNDSRTEGNSGTDANGYYSTAIKIDNQTADCDLIVTDSTPGLPGYEISFVTNENNTVTYYWKNGTETHGPIVYQAGVNPGSVTLNGEWTLEYTVTMPTGTTKTYRQTFLFDNANPSVKLNLLQSAVGADKRFTAEASDLNNITSFTYQLYTINGDAVGDPVALQSGRPMVSAEVLLQPEDPGLYYVEVTAVDTNGQTSVVKSDMFVIRNAEPEIKIDSLKAEGVNSEWNKIDLTHNGMPLTNDPTYRLEFTVFEPIADIEEDNDGNSKLSGDYYLYYRFSADGINYGEWQKSQYPALKMWGREGLERSVEVVNPTILREGENRIWIQAAFAPDGTAAAEIPHSFFSVNAEQYVFLDSTAPTFTFELDSTERTNSAVDGTLIFSDANTAPDEIKVEYSAYGYMFPVDDKTVNAKGGDTADDDGTDNDGASDGSESAEGESTEGETTEAVDAGERTLRVRITRNFGDDPSTPEEETEGYITLTDKAGNEAIVPIEVFCIDMMGPVIYLESANAIEAGERQDYLVDFWIDEADDSATEFALIKPLVDEDFYFGEINPSTTPDPNHPGQLVDPDLTSDKIVWGAAPDDDMLTDGQHGTVKGYSGLEIYPVETDIMYPNGESRTHYQIRVYGDEYVEGSNKEQPFILAVKTRDMLKNETIESVGTWMNLVNATASVKKASSIYEYAYQVAGINLEMTVPVYVMSSDTIPAEVLALPDGRFDHLVIDTVNDSEEEKARKNAIISYAESINDSATYYTTAPSVTLKENEIADGSYVLCFADEAGRVYKQTLNVKAPTDKLETDSETTVYLAFTTQPPVDAVMYGDYSLSADSVIPADSVKVYASDRYVVLTLTHENAKFTTVQSSNSGTYYDGYWGTYMPDEDFTLDEYLSDDTTKVFLLNDTLNPNKSIFYAVEITEGDTKTTVGSSFQLNLLDTTPPQISVSYSEKDFTNQSVTAVINAFDAQLMTGGELETDDENAEVGNYGIKEIALTDFIPTKDEEGYEVIFTEGSLSDDMFIYTYADVAEASVTFNESAYVGVRVTNELGLVTYKLLSVTNICKDDILEYEDYEVVYYDPHDFVTREDWYEENYDDDEFVYNSDEYYYDYDTEKYYKLIDSEKYYSEIVAKINVDEYTKGMSVINNGGRNTITLTAKNPKSTFHVTDKYGNEATVSVGHTQFDATAPVFADEPFTFEKTGKTNESYRVWINVSDAQSGIKDVSAVWYGVNGAEPVTCEMDTENGQYYITVESSGTYTVTVTDNSSNSTEQSMYIDNIDKTLPFIAVAVPTEDQLTRADVAVKLYYSEPNVTLISVVPNEGTKPSDISVNYADSVIRFFNNGGVTVTFMDEYGNTGTYQFGVENIWREAPNFKANVTTEDGGVTATVSFEPDGGVAKFDLSKYYVVHSGITPMHYEYDREGKIVSQRVQTMGDEIRFTFYENGTYIFYVYDEFGNMQKITEKITVIDKDPPTITDVSWSYSYLDKNGQRVEVKQNIKPDVDTSGTEAGYNVAADSDHPATNEDVTVTVKTNTETRPVGAKEDEQYTTDHSVIYDEDGWYNFYLEKPNGLMDSYGVGIYLIDKEAPVFADFDDLMFFENPKANAPFDLNLLKVTAYDERYGKTTDLTASIKYSYIYDGVTYNVDSFDGLSAIVDHFEYGYDKTKPVTVIYTVADAVGNETTVRRTVTFVGLFDTTIRVNGDYTDANGMIEVDGANVTLQLDNFWGIAYARYTQGIYTMAQMKNKGTPISGANGSFTLTDLDEGWYTFYVQTDLRDYFCVKVYVYGK